MVRREKGLKRYARQREKMFTDSLIREDEITFVREAQGRLSCGRIQNTIEEKRKKREL